MVCNIPANERDERQHQQQQQYRKMGHINRTLSTTCIQVHINTMR